MKRIAVLTLLVGLAVGLFLVTRKKPAEIDSYKENIVFALEQMRHIRMPDGTANIGSSVRPLGQSPHPFFLLTRYLSATVVPPDLELMLKDSNPAVRLAAAEIILWDNRWAMDKKAVEVLLNDPEVVTVLDDCIPTRTTVGKVVLALKQDSRLFYKERTEPNK